MEIKKTDIVSTGRKSNILRITEKKKNKNIRSAIYIYIYQEI